jgi:lipopolysaccharide/colanic/teichoic acid biosynthesis glycosyltransferase
MRFSKRFVDLFLVVIAAPFVAPLFLIVALAIKLDDGGPVFFVQERVGFRGSTFRMLKFRTMVQDADREGRLITVANDARITRAGRWLRKSKLDELPQLVNVLRGDMSLVGPRPEVPKYVARYSVDQRRVLELVPGITDPASIAFRDEASLLVDCTNPEQTYIERIMPEKIALNLAYASKAGILSDMMVIMGTLKALWGRGD